LNRFHHTARRELKEAAEWYEQEVPGLGKQFLDEVAAALEILQEFPRSAPVVRGALRCQVLARFPYNLIYEPWEDGSLYVLAVAHQKRRPIYWADRS
jgi:toxin ParE1/3/4